MMKYFAKKITIGIWRSPKIKKNLASIPADCVTVSLRTRGNRMSCWQCDDVEKSKKEVLLALASGFDDVSKVDLVFLPRTDIEKLDIPWKQEDGDTPVVRLKSNHIDLLKLRVKELIRLTKLVRTIIKEDANINYLFCTYDEEQILKEIKEECKRDPSLRERLKEKLREKVDNYV